jgi:hypothetical protein
MSLSSLSDQLGRNTTVMKLRSFFKINNILSRTHSVRQALLFSGPVPNDSFPVMDSYVETPEPERALGSHPQSQLQITPTATEASLPVQKSGMGSGVRKLFT